MYLSFLRCKFYRISHNIQQYLPDSERITLHHNPLQRFIFTSKLDVLLFRLRLNNPFDIFDHLIQLEYFFHEHNLSTFDFTHIQNRVDQTQ